MRFPKHALLPARNIERLLVHLTECDCTVQLPPWRLRGCVHAPIRTCACKAPGALAQHTAAASTSDSFLRPYRLCSGACQGYADTMGLR